MLHHLLPATGPRGSTFIYEQSEGLRLGGFQLLLLGEVHSVKVWKWLCLKLRYLESWRRESDLVFVLIPRFKDIFRMSDFTSSFRLSSSLFSFNTFLSRSLSSKEKGQTSTWWFSGRRGWKGRPKWGTGGALTGECCLTWQRKTPTRFKVINKRVAVVDRHVRWVKGKNWEAFKINTSNNKKVSLTSSTLGSLWTLCLRAKAGDSGTVAGRTFLSGKPCGWDFFFYYSHNNNIIFSRPQTKISQS